MQGTYLHIKKYFRWYLLLLLIVASVVLWRAYLKESREGVLTFAVLDVGQGDALFIESPTGKQVLVDGGAGKNLLREISKVVPWYDRDLDVLFVTNPDRDHYEGFISLLDKYRVDLFVESGTKNTEGSYDVLLNKIGSKGIKKITALRGQRVDIGGGAYLEILFPDRDISGLSPNDGSIVMKLVYGETSALLQGDSTARIEGYLLTLGTTTLRADIYKVGHHGSKTSNTLEYLTAVKPLWAVISSGEENSYGHPHKDTLENLKTLNIKTFATCNNGRIVFESDGRTFTLKNKAPKEAVVGCKSK